MIEAFRTMVVVLSSLMSVECHCIPIPFSNSLNAITPRWKMQFDRNGKKK